MCALSWFILNFLVVCVAQLLFIKDEQEAFFMGVKLEKSHKYYQLVVGVHIVSVVLLAIAFLASVIR